MPIDLRLSAAGSPAYTRKLTRSRTVWSYSVLVWLPVVLYVVAGGRAEEWIASAQRWVSAHQDPLTFYPSLVVGLVLVVDGVWGLLGG